MLGFYLTDVKGEANRRALFQDALTFLRRDAAVAPISAADASSKPATPEPAPQATAPAAGATGTTQLSTDAH